MLRLAINFIAILMFVSFSVSAYAGQYVLHNQLGETITSVKAQQGDGWSSNWLAPGQAVHPGSAVQLMFFDEKTCVLDFAIITGSGQQYRYSCNICNKMNLIVNQSSMSCQ